MLMAWVIFLAIKLAPQDHLHSLGIFDCSRPPCCLSVVSFCLCNIWVLVTVLHSCYLAGNLTFSLLTTFPLTTICHYTTILFLKPMLHEVSQIVHISLIPGKKLNVIMHNKCLMVALPLDLYLITLCDDLIEGV